MRNICKYLHESTILIEEPILAIHSGSTYNLLLSLSFKRGINTLSSRWVLKGAANRAGQNQRTGPGWPLEVQTHPGLLYKQK